MRDEPAEPLLGIGTRAARRVAEVQLDARRRRDDVGGDAALDPHGADDLAVDEPVQLDLDGLEADDRLQAAHELVDRVHAGPRARRVRALAAERHRRLEVAETAGVEDAVGRLEHDDEPGAL